MTPIDETAEPRSAPEDGSTSQDFGHCVFVGGCSRSGTTLLGSMLGAAACAIVTPESQFKSDIRKALGRGELDVEPSAVRGALAAHWRFRIWGTDLPDAVGPSDRLNDLVLRAVRAYAIEHQKPEASWWIDHSPDNIRDATWLLEDYPEAKVVHLVRDGRAVAASLIKMDVGPNTVLAAAKLWVQSVGTGLAMEDAYPSRVLQVRFEELVAEPLTVLRRISAFTGLPVSDRMIEGGDFDVPSYTKSQHELVGEPPDLSAATRWREKLSSREIELIEVVAGPMLEALGYELRFGGSARPPSTPERLVEVFRNYLWGRARSFFLGRRRRRRAGVAR